MLRRSLLSRPSLRPRLLTPRQHLSTLPPPPLASHAIPTPIPRQPKFYSRHPILFSLFVAPIIVTSSALLIGLGLLGYDASTYSEKHVERVALDLVRLKMERGGKKGLGIVNALVDDEEGDMIAGRKRLVIVGGGWGAVGVIKNIDRKAWHVTVVSPDNYFLFQPLLPSATVGTVEVRTLVEPLRKILARVHGHFLQAKAVDLDMELQLVEVAGVGGGENFYLPYDRLIIAVGSSTATHGVPGLSNCFQLKTISDAQAIRRRVMDNLERAALPSTSPEERKTLLSFVVCGGGPTGVEFASELWDLVSEDVLKYMPKVLRDEVSVHIIQSRDHILNTYAESISRYAEEKFARNEIDTILNARVKEVTPSSVIYTTKTADGKTIDHELPSGFTLWSTGIAMNPFTVKVASLLRNQYHAHALEVDAHLRVLGAPLGTAYAIGDCATIETRLVDHLLEMVRVCDENGDGVVDEREFERLMKIVDRKFPTAQIHVEQIRDVFEQYANSEHVLGLNELAKMFLEISKRMTALPATAQVANQQGVYLGKKLTKLAKVELKEEVKLPYTTEDWDDNVHPPFRYRHLGSLAYVGNSAVFDLDDWSFAGGLVAMYLWRGIYWDMQVSSRTQALLMVDWVKRGIFGRDLSRF